MVKEVEISWTIDTLLCKGALHYRDRLLGVRSRIRTICGVHLATAYVSEGVSVNRKITSMVAYSPAAMTTNPSHTGSDCVTEEVYQSRKNTERAESVWTK